MGDGRTPSEGMQAKLTLQKQAAIAVIEADNDARLRRALLRNTRPPNMCTTQANECFTGEMHQELDQNYAGRDQQQW